MKRIMIYHTVKREERESSSMLMATLTNQIKVKFEDALKMILHTTS